VTWEIEPQPGGVTKLTVVHDQLEASPKTAERVGRLDVHHQWPQDAARDGPAAG
jgi:hypothetical protein